jgi:hypothetical protein
MPSSPAALSRVSLPPPTRVVMSTGGWNSERRVCTGVPIGVGSQTLKLCLVLGRDARNFSRLGVLLLLVMSVSWWCRGVGSIPHPIPPPPRPPRPYAVCTGLAGPSPLPIVLHRLLPSRVHVCTTLLCCLLFLCVARPPQTLIRTARLLPVGGGISPVGHAGYPLSTFPRVAHDVHGYRKCAVSRAYTYCCVLFPLPPACRVGYEVQRVW